MHWYRRLMFLFPKAFRDRFGRDMAEVFADRRQHARTRGLRAVLALWAWTIADVIQHGFAERRAVRARRARRNSVMSTIVQDVRYAVRLFVRRPGFTAVALATVALSIGVNVTIFSILNRTVLHEPPFPQADDIVRVFERANQPSSVPNFIDVRDGSRDQFSTLAAWRYPVPAMLGGPDDASRVSVVSATPELFDVMGVSPFMGRPLTNDDVATSARAIVISHALWRGRLGADPGVVGRQLQLDGQAWTVVGVLRDAVALPAADIWQPLIFTPQQLAA